MRNLLLVCLLLAFTAAQAQIQSPAPSPSAKLETVVGLTDVSVEYSRPGKKGREIFGEGGLVPYGEIWRTGANQATKITFGDDVTVDNAPIPAGSYAILSRPMQDNWEVMMYPYEGGNWGSYVDKEPAVTLTADVGSTGSTVETFTIGVRDYTLDGAELVMMWGDTEATLPIMTDARASVTASIERTMAGPGMNDYFQAANFLHESNGDKEQALEYIQTANEMAGEQPRYWMVRREALILHDLGRKDEAVETARRSLELAQEAGNMDYVRMNEKSIEEWTM